MKNKLGIISALVLSFAIAGSAFAATTHTNHLKPKTAAASAKVSNKKVKTKKHKKAKHVKKVVKTKKTATPAASK